MHVCVCVYLYVCVREYVVCEMLSYLVGDVCSKQRIATKEHNHVTSALTSTTSTLTPLEAIPLNCKSCSHFHNSSRSFVWRPAFSEFDDPCSLDSSSLIWWLVLSLNDDPRTFNAMMTSTFYRNASQWPVTLECESMTSDSGTRDDDQCHF